MITSFETYNKPKVSIEAVVGYDNSTQELIVTVYENGVVKYDFILSDEDSLALAKLVVEDQTK